MIVAADTEVVEVAPQAPMERGVLVLNRLMPMAAAPVVDGRLGPSEACAPRLAPHPPVPVPSSPPIEREPDTVKGGRTFATLLLLGRTPKGQQTCLVRVQGQSKAPQALVKHRHHPPCIVLVFKADHKVVGVPDQSRLTPQSRLHLGLEPSVEHIMEIDVPQQRRKHRPLDGTQLRLEKRLAVEYPHVQALPDEPQKRPIRDPNLEHLLQLGAIQAVEEGHDVRLEEPPHLAPINKPLETAHGVMGTALGPKPVRAVHKVLLVDGLQHLTHSVLDQFKTS